MSIFMKDEGYKEESSQEKLLALLIAYQQAVDTSIISSITDPKGVIVHVNKKFCEVSKFTADELIGQDHRIINSSYHTKEFLRDMWRTIAQGKVWHGEIKNKAKDGSFYWVDSVIVPIKDHLGKPAQYLSLRTLISERKAKEEKEREERINSMEEMLYKISHEVRQPVVQILGLSHLFESSLDADEDLKITIEGIKQSAVQLDNYTRELAQFVHEIRNTQNADLLSYQK